MKKLYRKGTVHPSPPIISNHLAFLPATILTLTVALSQEEKEVLAYLISCSSSSSSNGNPRRTTKTVVDHPPVFHCSCFRCYTNYWVRWDNSPNNQLIHQIIDAFEDSLAKKKDRRYKKGSNRKSTELKRSELTISSMDSASVSSSSSAELESATSNSNSEYNTSVGGDDDASEGIEVEVEDEEEKGTVRRFVSFIGERIWNAWGQ